MSEADRELLWFEFYQNNSGGRNIEDELVAKHVFVQANSAEEAMNKANYITEDSGIDWCECCGERWYISVDDKDGTTEPMVFGEPITAATSWVIGHSVRLHYADGRVEKTVVRAAAEIGKS